MGNYILRNIDPELWRAVTTKAEGEGRTLRAVILLLLERYASGQIKL